MKTLLALTGLVMLALAVTFLSRGSRGYDNVRVLHPGMTYTVKTITPDAIVCVSDKYDLALFGSHYQVARLEKSSFSFLEKGERFEVNDYNGPISGNTKNTSYYIHELASN